MTDILVPTEQEGTKAVVKTWLKKVGDAVKVDDPIVELETDKVAVEVAATSAGVLSEILVADGAEVEPGTVLGRITSGGAVEATAKAMAQPIVIRSPRFTVALGFTRSHKPAVAITVATITCRSNRCRMSGTIITYKAVRNALFEALVYARPTV